MKKVKKNPNTVLSNKKAFHEYTILDRYEAGIALTGTEVKSIRSHGANFRDSFVKIEGGEAFLVSFHIAQYKMSKYFNHEPLRKRRLLLNKREIRKLYGKVSEKGLTIVPLKLYFKNGLLKVEIGLARGKQLFDKRESLKKKDMEKEWKRKKSF